MTSWPLTSLQTSMVFQTIYGSLTGNYIQQFVCRSGIPVGREAIARAISTVCNRHVALRLQFQWDRGETVQTVVPSVEVPVEVRPWENETQWDEFLRADRTRGFDLRCAPLVRVTVFTGAPEAARFVMTSHHALLDGKSRRIVMREFFQLLQEDRTSALPPVALPYTEYLEWLAAQDHSASKDFWQDYLRGVRAAAHLPLPESLGVPDDSAPGLQSAQLSEAETLTLRSSAASSGCTLNNLIQAGWACVLGRYSGTDEVVFGATRACRYSPLNGAASETVGLLINNVPLRVSLRKGVTVRTLLATLKDLQWRLRDRENTPLPDIAAAAALQPGEYLYRAYLMFDDRGASDPAIFPGPNSPGSNCLNWNCELREQTEMLNLSAIAGQRISLTLEYDRARYTDSAMARLLGDFCRVLAEIASAPDREIDCLRGFNLSVILNPATRPGEFSSVVEAVRHWSRTMPDQPAVLTEAGITTYAELEILSNRLAHRLRADGILPGSLVGVSIDNRLHLVAAFLGIWKAGCAYVPFDTRYPQERRAWMLENSRAALVLSAFPDCSNQPDSPPELRCENDSPAYVVYTSGSTGSPKGVIISQGSLANLCSAISAEYRIAQSDRVLQASTVSFDISVEEIFPTLWSGATVVPATQDAISSSSDFGDFVAQTECTVLDLPTAFWHELVTGIAESGRGLPPSVRLLAVGGERVLPEVYATWTTLPDARRVRWLNTYGPTEATVTATVFDPQGQPVAGSMPIGRPIRGVNAYVLDAHMRASPLEAAGELFVGGAGTALGYLNLPERTSAKFPNDPWNPGARMFKTGDRARLLETGELEYLGRTDFQVKFRGFRIELVEVEIAAESHPDVIQAIAQVRPANSLVLFAAFAPSAPSAASSQSSVSSLHEWLRAKLPEWMLPTSIVFLPRLPTTVAGKVDRDALARLPVAVENVSTVAEPATELERDLVKIWASLFRKSSVGVDENFFLLGGYSLLAMRMLVQVEKRIGHTVRFADLSRAPTIRQFAQAIAGKETPLLPECLVVLNDVLKDAGSSSSEPALFCFHGVGGVAHWFNDLAARIQDRPVIGVLCPENPDRPFPATLEEMCDTYVDAIRQVQPSGPYHLIGHSMGGMLAYHCAVLCARRGHPVGLAASLDGWNRAADSPSASGKVLRWVRYFWSLNRREKLDFAARKLQWIRVESSRRRVQARLGSDSNSLLRAIRTNNLRLASQYTAPPYPGEFHVFRARTRSATQNADPALGWAGVAARVVTRDVPGDHYTLLSPPHVDTLANRLRVLLRSNSLAGK